MFVFQVGPTELLAIEDDIRHNMVEAGVAREVPHSTLFVFMLCIVLSVVVINIHALFDVMCATE